MTTLENFIRQAEDHELYLANPRYLAEALGWDQTHTLDILTLAAYEKLWHLAWETYCPSCGMFLQRAGTLGELETDYSCEGCHTEAEIHLDEAIMVRASLDENLRSLDKKNRDDPAFRADVDARLGPLPALQVINRPYFRELLGERNLPANQSLGVQNMAIFFSDLKGSTALYERLGDAAAYNIVRQHFDIVFAAVEQYGGSAVKTMGDGVMGTFFNNADALKGIAASIRGVQAFNDQAGLIGIDRLSLKVGLHTGPSIVVTMNHHLDYFGSTANIAARLSALAAADNLVFSRDIVADPQALKVAQELGHVMGLEARPRGLEQSMSLLKIDFSV